MKADPFLIFVHIQKTGGMTLQRMLRARYGPSVWSRAITRLKRQSLEGLPIQDAAGRLPASRRYFAGHFGYGVHTLLPSPSTYITVLREPIDRLVSLYYYSRDTPHAFYHSHAQGKTIEQFLLDTELHELDNGQLRFIIGNETDFFLDRSGYGCCDQQLLDRGKRILREEFLLAAPLDQFDAFVLLLGRELGWRHSYYLRQNEGQSGSRQPISEDLRRQLEIRQRWEIELYRYVRELFAEKVSAAGVDFERELTQFVLGNRRYQRVWDRPYRAWSSAKGIVRRWIT